MNESETSGQGNPELKQSQIAPAEDSGPPAPAALARSRNGFDRRSFLAGAAAGLLTAFIRTEVATAENYQATEKRLGSELEFKELGPPVHHLSAKPPGQGIRAFWTDENNANQMIAGTWQHGVWISNDGGAHWTQEQPFGPGDGGVARDFIALADGSTLMIADYAVSLRTNRGTWQSYPILLGHQGIDWAQSGCQTKDKTIILTGFRGVISSDDMHIWHQAEGISRDNLIRTVAQDKETGLVYCGGWGEFRSLDGGVPMSEGTGLLVSNDNGKSFQVDPLNEKMKSIQGKININSIELSKYKGSKFILIGGQGTNYVAGAKAEDYPYFFVVKDGEVVPKELVNLPSLTAELGQDSVAPNTGIKVESGTGMIYVSSWAANIASANLNDLLEGKALTWQRVSPVNPKTGTFGAGHIRLATDPDNGDRKLVSGGQYWSGTSLPFLPLREAKIGNRRKIVIPAVDQRTKR